MDHLFRKRPAHPFTQNGNLCRNINSRFEIRLRFAALVDSLIAGANSHYGVAVV